MADKKIIDLVEITTPNTSDFLPIANAGLTRKVTLDNFVQQSTYSTKNIGSLTLQSSLNPTDQLPLVTGSGDVRKITGNVLASRTQLNSVSSTAFTQLTTAILSVSSITATGTLSARTLQDRFADVINVKDFGAKGDGVTDDTAAIQAAINAALITNTKKVFLPSTNASYRLTSTINLSSYVYLYGTGSSISSPWATTFTNNRQGSWLYFDHTGVGLSATVEFAGCVFKDFGTYRNQPWISVNWAPSAYDFDLVFDGCIDTVIENLLLQNPTKGIQYKREGGRHTINGLKSQPFNIGIQVETAYDVCRFNDVHLWPFYLDNGNVHHYTRSNLIGLDLLRCDNPNITNYFTFASKYGIRLGQGTNGVTSRALITNYATDAIGDVSVLIDGAGTTAQLTNGYTFGTYIGGLSSTNAVLVSANNTYLQLTNFRSSFTQNEAIKIISNNSTIVCSDLFLEYWNSSNTSKNAISVSNDTSKIIVGNKIVSLGGNGQPLLNDPYRISSSEWLTFTPIVSSSSGTINSYTATGLYNVNNNTVTYNIRINIINAGTASGFGRFTLPFNRPVDNYSVGVGRELALTGKALTTTFASTSGDVVVYDNSSPFVTGYLWQLNGQYQIT